MSFSMSTFNLHRDMSRAGEGGQGLGCLLPSTHIFSHYDWACKYSAAKRPAPSRPIVLPERLVVVLAAVLEVAHWPRHHPRELCVHGQEGVGIHHFADQLRSTVAGTQEAGSGRVAGGHGWAGAHSRWRERGSGSHRGLAVVRGTNRFCCSPPTPSSPAPGCLATPPARAGCRRPASGLSASHPLRPPCWLHPTQGGAPAVSAGGAALETLKISGSWAAAAGGHTGLWLALRHFCRAHSQWGDAEG
jgi:hypothetical protein